MTPRKRDPDPAHHLGLVHEIVHRLGGSTRYRFLRDDMLQVGKVALVVACRRWDPDGGASVPAYVGWYVEKLVRAYVRAEVRAGYGLSPYSKRQATRRVLPFSQSGAGFVTGEAPELAYESDQSDETGEHARHAVSALMAGLLDPRLRDVVRRRCGLPPYHEPQTLIEIGAAFGITRERARQLEMDALARLRRRAARLAAARAVE